MLWLSASERWGPDSLWGGCLGIHRQVECGRPRPSFDTRLFEIMVLNSEQMPMTNGSGLCGSVALACSADLLSPNASGEG